MDTSQQLPDDFVQLCQSVTAKRPKAVIDQIDRRVPFEVDGEPIWGNFYCSRKA